MDRRAFLAGLGAAALAVRLGAQGQPAVGSKTRTMSALRDRHFQLGCDVLKAGSPDAEIAGVIRPPGSTGRPAWRAAQWHSRFNLAAAPLERLPSGSAKFFDGAKAVTFGRPASPEADLILALDGRREWAGVAPTPVSTWPHLLVEQTLPGQPALPEFRTVPLRISYRLLRAEAPREPAWNDGRHTAQFLLYLTVQNLNRKSAGFGDYLWFGVPLYDARYPLPQRHLARDVGKRATGKFIFSPGGETYSKEPAADGHWITIDRDLRPLLHEALDAAWSAGFLPDSRTVRDYRLGGINLGWEVTGPWNVAMQVRDLDLQPTVSGDV